MLYICETEGERDTPCAGKLSLLNNKTKEVDPKPTPEPAVEPQQETVIEELTEDIQKVMIGEVQGEKMEREIKRRVEFEAGTWEVERRNGQLPSGWVWVWTEDPWTGFWERLRVPKEEADHRKRAEISPRTSYWGEAKVDEWRRKLREEKE